jgi:hypothetical protein
VALDVQDLAAVDVQDLAALDVEDPKDLTAPFSL